MAETGVLRPGMRVELLDGRIMDMSPIGPFQGSITKYLNQLFTGAAKGRWLVAVQDPIRLDDHSEPQPDLALLKPAGDFYRQRHPVPTDVFLLIEVADSSLENDQEHKLPAYGRAGVPEVWTVNLNELTLEVYREPNFTGYGGKAILRAGDHATPLAFPEVTVDVGRLLQP